MGQMFSRLSDWVQGRRDPPVEELVTIRFIPLPDEGHCYVLFEDYDQRDADHRHDITMWYLDQFDEDPDEQMARWAQLDVQGFGGPLDAEEDLEEMPRFLKNVHFEPESSSGDSTSHLVEAIERLGNLSLVEYERKFDKLSQYAPHLVDTKERKARRFKNGLRSELYNAVAIFQFSTYSEILQRVQLIAKDPAPVASGPAGSSSTPAKKQWKRSFLQK
ncbi:hypothetical protein FNV43_RR02374 [Rhamnella rubrinervis]|uniref:Retrotransposon gag domain-containing protein n=1 Tax=Rhamnella rubrinervis TaxID=2594499 RepID=A0A8K0MSX5_9ROSA|nr:hypothetical protein FNV43_RR02374 [Rhamnella rubrinervis]